MWPFKKKVVEEVIDDAEKVIRPFINKICAEIEKGEIKEDNSLYPFYSVRLIKSNVVFSFYQGCSGIDTESLSIEEVYTALSLYECKLLLKFLGEHQIKKALQKAENDKNKLEAKIKEIEAW